MHEGRSTPPVPPVLVDGWVLRDADAGAGSFAAQWIRACAESPQGHGLRVVVPGHLRARAVALAGAERVMTLHCPRLPYALLDRVCWQHALAATVRRAHAPTLLYSPGPFWSVAPPRIVISCYDMIPRHFPQYLAGRPLRRFVARRSEACLKRAQAVITASVHARDDIMACTGIPIGRIAVIPLFVSPAFTPDAARLAAPRVRGHYRLPEDYLLYLGGYDGRKNVDLLVDAYAEAHRRYGALRPLVLAGRLPARGPSRRRPVCDVHAALQRARLPAGAVSLPGLIAPEDLPGLYGGARALLYPSRYEGFGLPPLEAMSCGCPALVADTSSLPEIVPDPACRFDPDDTAALAALIDACCRVRPMVSAEPVSARFDRQRIVGQYREVFLQAMKDARV